MSRTALALIVLAALLGFWCLGAHNRLVRLRQAIQQSWAAVDAQLQCRHALARELVERLAAPEAQPAVGDELAHAAVQMLTAAVRQAETAAAQARLRATSAGPIQSLAMAEQVLDNALRPLALLIHARSRRLQRAGLHEPLRELLQREPDIEHQAAFARRLFNAAVADFNGAIGELPTRLLAGPMRFRRAAGFQVDKPEGVRLAPLPPLVARPAPAVPKEVLALPVVDMAARPAAVSVDEAAGPALPADGPAVGRPLAHAEDPSASAGMTQTAPVRDAGPTAVEASPATRPEGLATPTDFGAEGLPPALVWPASTIDLSGQAIQQQVDAHRAEHGPATPPVPLR